MVGGWEGGSARESAIERAGERGRERDKFFVVRARGVLAQERAQSEILSLAERMRELAHELCLM